jgi:arylsulfatase A-like enzyme
VALWLQAAGYRTGHVGKYLNEYGQSPSAPEDSLLNPRYVPRGWDDWQALADLSTYNVFGYRINDNGTLVPYGDAPEEYQTAVLADRAARFITTSLAQGRPLFLTITPLAPHIELFTMLLAPGEGYPDMWRYFIRPDPRDEARKPARWRHIFQALPLAPQSKPSFNEDDVRDKPVSLRRPGMTAEDIAALTWQYRTRFASMLAVDDLVGVVAAALGDQLPHTIIVFTSDNGFLYAEHRMSEKVAAYEESIRVPLFVAGPGVVGPRDAHAIALNNDLAPTIAALAGATPAAPVDGRSLVGFLGGPPPASWRQRFLVEHWGAGDPRDLPTYVAVRTGPDDAYGNRLYVEYSGDPLWPAGVTDTELYDMSPMADPYQTDSRHGDPGRLLERIALHYQIQRLRWCGAAGAPTCEEAER